MKPLLQGDQRHCGEHSRLRQCRLGKQRHHCGEKIWLHRASLTRPAAVKYTIGLTVALRADEFHQRPTCLRSFTRTAYSRKRRSAGTMSRRRVRCGPLRRRVFPKYVPDCLFPKCGIGHGVSGKTERLKTGVTEPAAVAAGPGSGAESWSHQRGQRCAVGWLHAAPAATKGCHFYLAKNVSFLNSGNKAKTQFRLAMTVLHPPLSIARRSRSWRRRSTIATSACDWISRSSASSGRYRGSSLGPFALGTSRPRAIR